ncbi:FBLI1 protein, partial [Anthoscopus minutus]|nr:FBLI1 protein [Anthoscopus minutus]
MLPGKAEKRIASSIFITLTSPRGDVATKEKTQCELQLDGAKVPGTRHPQILLSPPTLPSGGCVCSPLPSTYQCCLSPGALIAFAFGDGQRVLLQRCWSVTGHYSSPKPPHMSLGAETHPVAPVPSSSPVLPISEVPQPLSTEALGLALQQLDLAAPATPQAPSSFPAEWRPPTVCQEQPSKWQRKDVNGCPERDSSRDICAFCHKALGPRELTVEAMRKQYHPDCFTCRTCHRLLAGQRYFQRDGCPTCDTCFQATLEKCAKCQELITEHIVRALGKGYHPSCFSCTACGQAIGTKSFAMDEQGDVYCVPDFYRNYATVCSACKCPIVPHDDEDTYKIECLGRSFHESCYCCESCRMPLSLELTENGCYPLDDHLLCKSCHLRWRHKLSC